MSDLSPMPDAPEVPSAMAEPAPAPAPEPPAPAGPDDAPPPNEPAPDAPPSPPGVPEAYELKLGDDPLDLTEAEVALFKDVGLSNDAAQKLVAYMQETFLPHVMQAKQELESERLMNTWGMTDKAALTERMSSIKAWADKSLPAPLVAELSKTSGGVAALFQMMQSGSPAMPQGQAPAPASRDKLQSMMNDERYWNGRDPAYRKEVEAYAARVAGA